MKLKNILTSLLAVAAMVGCDKGEAYKVISSEEKTFTGTQLMVHNTSSKDTKLSFDLNGSVTGGTLEVTALWDSGDKFSVFNQTDGAYVCDFTMCESFSSELSIFKTDITLPSGNYYAVYPATTATNYNDVVATNDGKTLTKKDETLDHIKDGYRMKTSFDYEDGSDVSIMFDNLNALLVINAAITDQSYNKMVVKESGKEYTLLLDGISSTYLTEMELLVDPATKESREIVIEFYNDESLVHSESKTIESEFKAGNIYYYVGPVSDLMWSGETAPIEKGSGTKSDPWIIETPEQLAGVASGGYYRISSGGAAFNLGSKEWTPIPNNTFTNFDGGGIVIKNLKISQSEDMYTGLFAYINESSLIQNFTLTNADVSSVNTTKEVYVGALAGIVYKSCNIINCHVKNSNISISGITTSIAGGLVGFTKFDKENYVECSVSGTTVTSTGAAGGVVGSITGNCRFSACNTTNTSVAGYTSGGIVGSIGSTSDPKVIKDIQLEGCFVESGKVVSANKGTVIGGLYGVGYAKIYGCYTNNMTFETTSAGSLVGKISEAICTNGTRFSQLNEMIYGSYTTHTNPVAGSTTIKSWDKNNSYSVSQSAISVNCNNSNDFSGAEGTTIAVSSIGDEQVTIMNEAIAYGLTNTKSAHTKVSSMVYEKAPDGYPAPYIVTVEYK